MAKNPIGPIKDTALDALRHPLGTAHKAVGQVVGQTAGVARDTAGVVIDRVTALVPGRSTARPDRDSPLEAPAEQAQKERKVHGDPLTPAPGTPAKAPAKKTPAKKTAAKKAPSKKAATTAPAKKAAARSATRRSPLTAAQVAEGDTSEVTTPVGTTGAAAATNPDTTDTDLQQPGTEPLVDPATVKAVASESEMLQKGADLDKG